MPDITLIGAGSVVFTRNLCSDILLTPALQESTIRLMDIDERRLAQARELVQALIDARPARPCRSYHRSARGHLRHRLRNRHLPAGGPGRLRARHPDPPTLWCRAVHRRHAWARRGSLRTTCYPGVDRFGPRARPIGAGRAAAQLRHPHGRQLPAYDRATKRPHVGLCHSIQGTSEMLAGWIDVPLRLGALSLRRDQSPGVPPRVPPGRRGLLPAHPPGDRGPDHWSG